MYSAMGVDGGEVGTVLDVFVVAVVVAVGALQLVEGPGKSDWSLHLVCNISEGVLLDGGIGTGGKSVLHRTHVTHTPTYNPHKVLLGVSFV